MIISEGQVELTISKVQNIFLNTFVAAHKEKETRHREKVDGCSFGSRMGICGAPAKSSGAVVVIVSLFVSP